MCWWSVWRKWFVSSPVCFHLISCSLLTIKASGDFIELLAGRMVWKLNPHYIEPSLELTSALRKDVSQKSHWDRGITSWEGCHCRYSNSKVFPLWKFENLRLGFASLCLIKISSLPLSVYRGWYKVGISPSLRPVYAYFILYLGRLHTSPHMLCMCCMDPGLICSRLCFAFLSTSTLSILKLCHKNTAWPASKSIIATSVSALVLCSPPSGARLTQVSSRIWRTIMRFDLQCLTFWSNRSFKATASIVYSNSHKSNAGWQTEEYAADKVHCKETANGTHWSKRWVTNRADYLSVGQMHNMNCCDTCLVCVRAMAYQR